MLFIPGRSGGRDGGTALSEALCEQDYKEAGKADGIRDEAGEDEHEPAGEQECTFPEAAADEEPVLHPGGYADDADEG